MVLLRKIEKRRDAWRLEFVCGGRAKAAARADYDTLTRAATLLSCGLPDVPDVVSKTLDERRGMHSATKRLETRLAEQEAQALLGEAKGLADGTRVIITALDDATPNYLTQLAARVVAETAVVALLGSRGGGHLVFAQTKEFARDMGALLREILREFPGKGGGGKDFAQGALADAWQVDTALAKASTAVMGDKTVYRKG